MLPIWGHVVTAVAAVLFGVVLALTTKSRSITHENHNTRRRRIFSHQRSTNFTSPPNTSTNVRAEDRTTSPASLISETTTLPSALSDDTEGEETRATSPLSLILETDTLPSALSNDTEGEEAGATSPFSLISETDTLPSALSDDTEGEEARATSPISSESSFIVLSSPISSLGDEIEGLPQKTCAICLRHLRNRILKMLECDHLYHNDCIDKWLEIKQYCPTCMTPVIFNEQ